MFFLPGELCFNFSDSNDLTQMVNFPTLRSMIDSHSPALLDLFISSDTSICSTMAFLPLQNSDHVVVSVSIDFPSNSKQEAKFHHIAYESTLPAHVGIHHSSCWHMENADVNAEANC